MTITLNQPPRSMLNEKTERRKIAKLIPSRLDQKAENGKNPSLFNVNTGNKLLFLLRFPRLSNRQFSAFPECHKTQRKEPINPKKSELSHSSTS